MCIIRERFVIFILVRSATSRQFSHKYGIKPVNHLIDKTKIRSEIVLIKQHQTTETMHHRDYDGSQCGYMSDDGCKQRIKTKEMILPKAHLKIIWTATKSFPSFLSFFRFSIFFWAFLRVFFLWFVFDMNLRIAMRSSIFGQQETNGKQHNAALMDGIKSQLNDAVIIIILGFVSLHFSSCSQQWLLCWQSDVSVRV